MQGDSWHETGDGVFVCLLQSLGVGGVGGGGGSDVPADPARRSTRGEKSQLVDIDSHVRNRLSHPIPSLG